MFTTSPIRIGRKFSRSGPDGQDLEADMEQLVRSLQREAKKMFESEEFAQQRQSMIEELQKKQQQMMQALMEEAARSGFTLRMGPSGMVLLPTKNAKPMQEAEYLALSATEICSEHFDRVRANRQALEFLIKQSRSW